MSGVDVLNPIILSALHVIGAFAVIDALVKNPGFVKVYVILFGFAEEATVRPVPAARKLKVELEMPLIVVVPAPAVCTTHCTTPEAFVVSTWPVAQVVEARTRLAAKVLVVLKVCAAVHVAELAAVRKPGLMKEY